MSRRAVVCSCAVLAASTIGVQLAAEPGPQLPAVATAADPRCDPLPCDSADETCPVKPTDPSGPLSVRGHPWTGELPAAPAPTGEPGEDDRERGSFAPRKAAWERSVGGPLAAKDHLRRRLAGWPARFLVDRSDLPRGDRDFLRRVATDTWRGIAALTDRESGLPIDHVRFPKGSLEPSEAEIGDYVSPSSVGLYLIAVCAALELELTTREDALARLRLALETLTRLETHSGLLYNFYDTTSLERTSDFVSFVDSAWLSAGLMVVRGTFPELSETATGMIDARDFSFFYDSTYRQMSHGYYADEKRRSPYHYATLYTEARLGSLLAIGKGDVGEDHWFRMLRTFPEACTWQSLSPQQRRRKQVRGHPVVGGWYEWEGLRYVPSWGGSMFEALMPTLVVDEAALAPRSLGRNARAHVAVQRRYALEQLGWPVWGMSPSASPGIEGYLEYGVPVLGAKGYADAAVTPHAAALALAVDPEAATRNLRHLVEHYDLYGDFGFYDSVDPRTGKVATAYLILDQAMLFVAVANHLEAGAVQRRFASDPIAARALSILSDEDFLD